MDIHVKIYELERELVYAKTNKEYLRCFFLWLKIKRLKRKEDI